jgi:type II secretory pathway pseudopilin PulG
VIFSVLLFALVVLAGSSQADKVDDAAAKSEARNIAVAQETYYTDYGQYASSIAELEAKALYSPSSPSLVGTATTEAGGTSYSIRVQSLSGEPFCYASDSTTGFVDCG